MKINIFKIKKDKLEIWRKWCKELNTTRKEEAIETLKEEAVLIESWNTIEINGSWYALGSSLLDEKSESKYSEDREINKLHKKYKEDCLEFIGTSENNCLLKNIKTA
jgi:hypothetical protein